MNKQNLVNYLNEQKRNFIIPLISILLSLFISSILISLMGVNPFEAYKYLFSGALGSVNGISETIVKATPLILTALTFALSMKCGIVNIGAEGQLYIGALSATLVGILFPPMPMLLHLPLAIIVGFIGGGVWGLLAGILKVKFSANEIITTIMLNYVAIYFVGFMINGPLLEPPGFLRQTAKVAEGARLPRIFSGSRLHMGIFIALIALIFYYVFLKKTKQGYQVKVVGENKRAAKYAGMNVFSSILLVMFISGGFAGLAGSGEILGVQTRLLEGFSNGLGFDGIAVALLGRNHPVGILFAAIFFGAIRSGGNIMQLSTGLPIAVIYIIQALAVIFVVGGELFRREGFKPFKNILNKIKGMKVSADGN
ncbi:MAG: ABC transporter permease [Halanaerobiales bacterium]